jgi:hypothetical protein
VRTATDDVAPRNLTSDAKAVEAKHQKAAHLRWPGTPSMKSSMGILSLHMLKLACPYAIACLWTSFLRTLAEEHCHKLRQVGPRFNDKSLQSSRDVSAAQAHAADWAAGLPECSREETSSNSLAPFSEALLQQINQNLLYMQTAHKAWHYASMEAHEQAAQPEPVSVGDASHAATKGHNKLRLADLSNVLSPNSEQEQEHEIVDEGAQPERHSGGSCDSVKPESLASATSDLSQQPLNADKTGHTHRTESMPALHGEGEQWRTWLQKQASELGAENEHVHQETANESNHSHADISLHVERLALGDHEPQRDGQNQEDSQPGPVGEGRESSEVDESMLPDHVADSGAAEFSTETAADPPGPSEEQALDNVPVADKITPAPQWTAGALQMFQKELSQLLTSEEARLRGALLCLKHVQPGAMLLSGFLCCCQVCHSFSCWLRAS